MYPGDAFNTNIYKEGTVMEFDLGLAIGVERNS